MRSRASLYDTGLLKSSGCGLVALTFSPRSHAPSWIWKTGRLLGAASSCARVSRIASFWMPRTSAIPHPDRLKTVATAPAISFG